MKSKKHQRDIWGCLLVTDRAVAERGTQGWHSVSGTCQKNARWSTIATATTCPARADRAAVGLNGGRGGRQKYLWWQTTHGRRGKKLPPSCRCWSWQMDSFCILGIFQIYLCFTLQNKIEAEQTHALLSSRWPDLVAWPERLGFEPPQALSGVGVRSQEED